MCERRGALGKGLATQLHIVDYRARIVVRRYFQLDLDMDDGMEQRRVGCMLLGANGDYGEGHTVVMWRQSSSSSTDDRRM